MIKSHTKLKKSRLPSGCHNFLGSHDLSLLPLRVWRRKPVGSKADTIKEAKSRQSRGNAKVSEENIRGKGTLMKGKRNSSVQDGESSKRKKGKAQRLGGNKQRKKNELIKQGCLIQEAAGISINESHFYNYNNLIRDKELLSSVDHGLSCSAEKMWHLGSKMGVTYEGNVETFVERFRSMENRDRRGFEELGGNDGVK